MGDEETSNDWSAGGDTGGDTDPFGGGSEFGIAPGNLGSFGGTGALYGNSMWGLGGPQQVGQLGQPGQPMQQPMGGLQGLGGLGGLAQLLGVGLGGGGMLASLLGGGGSQTQTPKMTGQQIDTINNLKGLLGAQQPLQQAMYQQGAGMLQGLGQGQIPAGLTNLVNAAYQPYMQNLGQNAIEASQRAGFALPQDAMQGGPGLRIMGQGLAQLPGQMANTTLNTMFPLINALMNPGQQAVQNMQGAFNSLPGGGQTQNQPGAAQRFAQTGPFLQGIGNILNPSQYNLQMMNPITGFGNQQQQQQGGIPALGQPQY